MQKIPGPTERRLIQIYQFLQTYNKRKITSSELSCILCCKDTLVRYDLRFVDCVSGVSNGYDVEVLKNAISDVCKIKTSSEFKKCCIVGLGRLGAALLDDGFFLGSGFKVVAGFDSSVNRTEILRSTFPLYPATRIESVVAYEKIEYAILSVSEKESQIMAQRLSRCNIKGIVNFTATSLNVPQNIIVENVSPITALLNIYCRGIK